MSAQATSRNAATTAPPRSLVSILDWPWSKLADATLCFADANARLLAAQTAGDRQAVITATLDLDEATRDYHWCREKIAELWLMGFRIALDLQPVAVGESMGRLPVPHAASEVIEKLEDRMDEAEHAIIRLEGPQG